ncbi:DNA (cytosine-5-)-methyltransferase [Undibacterium aquatile]|uniref:Cytosine-specific methyltransferase n=2 Tax=Undibacterium aquatile TaxID=1537398 RepID=A0ABR6XB07_9BURK|nr:DNA (cytosine-5-)-methyltransferase [Undibacterium aquatile]
MFMPDPIQTHDSDAVLQYLAAARQFKTQEEIATILGVNARQVRRWEARENEPPPYLSYALQQILPLGDSDPDAAKNAAFTFIDLFAGIGGIRQAFDSVGGHCVFTSEWDTYAQKTYAHNYPNNHQINGDITQIAAENIPDHDVLLGGFPCQPFSIAGVSKKNALGRAHGFNDETQGTLFFDICRIIDEKKPRAFLLENVKNLTSHDKGRTFDVIKRSLEELGYTMSYRVIDGAHFVPQHRERILIVGFRNDLNIQFDLHGLDLPPKGERKLGDILHKTDGTEPFLPWDDSAYFDHKNKKPLDKYTLTDNLWTYLQNYAAKHKEKGNGFGFGLVTKDSVTRTLSARYYKDGSEILVSQGKNKNPRRLTPRECARLMGFPDTFKIPVSDTRAYKQFGNSVVVDVMSYIANAMSTHLT